MSFERIQIALKKLHNRGLACTFTVAEYGAEYGTMFKTYIATGNDNGPSHLDHKDIEGAALRLENYLDDSKGEMVELITKDIERFKGLIVEREAQLKEVIMGVV